MSSLSSSSSSEESFDSRAVITRRVQRRNMQFIRNMLPPLIGATIASLPIQKRHIYRNREGSHRQIFDDYFAENPTYPSEIFRHRFRMQKDLFLRILRDIKSYDDYFLRKRDCTGHLGCLSIQKMTAAIRILAYGYSTDHCDEYLKIGESTAIESLKHFCDAIIALYETQYMRSPNEEDVAKLLREGQERGFPGMLGSLDCMHWEWKNCPTAWHGTHRGHHHKPTLILEAVASKDLWIWHAFFGMVGFYNDLNVLSRSPLFDALIHGIMPPVNNEVNGHQYTLGYYLTDGIYPQWATLMQTIAHPTTVKEKLFAQKQESIRKDVERAFGVLQMRWGITQGPVRYWNKDNLCTIMKTCIILHNMIIEDERGIEVEGWRPPLDEEISHPEYNKNPSLLTTHISARLYRIRNKRANIDLRSDLMKHLLTLFGDKLV